MPRTGSVMDSLELTKSHGTNQSNPNQNSLLIPTTELLKMDPGPGGMTRANGVRLDRKGNPISRRKDGVLTKDRKTKMPHKIVFAD